MTSTGLGLSGRRPAGGNVAEPIEHIKLALIAMAPIGMEVVPMRHGDSLQRLLSGVRSLGRLST
jgi:hypothetical protein